MDIAGLSMAMSTATLQQQASIAIMKKQMEFSEMQGDNLAKMMEALPEAQLVQPPDAVGAKVDVSI